MLPNLTRDAKERSKIAGITRFVNVISSLLLGGAAMPFVISFGDKKAGYSMLGAVMGSLVIIGLGITFFQPKSAMRRKARDTRSCTFRISLEKTNRT
jgi:Na+/melibiose symporter-like transporter